MWERHHLQNRYDVVIIGAGVHGLATAFYLGKLGITKVAVLEKTYVGGGNSGRNTQIFRANYRNPQSVLFYNESVKLWEGLSQDLDYNLMLDQIGHITLAFTETSLDVLRLRVETNKALGVDSRLIGIGELKGLIPNLSLNGSRYPILGALYHPPGGVVRHDAVIWGLAHACEKMGIEIHPFTEVTGIKRNRGDRGHVESIIIKDGREIKCDYIVNATAGWCSTICQMVGIRLPVVTVPLQACVTEPVKPFLDTVVVGADLDIYLFQSDRGEVITGAELDSYSSYSYRSTLPTLELIASWTLELFPCLGNVNVLRQWTGICDMTPDFSPLIGEVPGVGGFILDVGWGTYGFKTGPASGKEVANLIATGKPSDIIRPFSLTRFYENRLLDEKAAGVCLRPVRSSYLLL
jgi:sarcosine oxidase subunit beta